jgi:hypothetical protein
LYEEASSKSTKHPVVCYSYGMFRLMHGMYPRERVWAEAQSLMNTARIMDPEHKMMQLSIDNFFHWGVLCNNRSGLARAQYALVFQCVLDDYDKAERYYRQVRGWGWCGGPPSVEVPPNPINQSPPPQPPPQPPGGTRERGRE